MKLKEILLIGRGVVTPIGNSMFYFFYFLNFHLRTVQIKWYLPHTRRPARSSMFVCILRPIIFHFRLNSHYIFFLLQVTEAVNLKRAETTAFRKANRLTRYTSSFLKESDKSTLQRTNQGYKQFKSMRGTAPYFEQQKLRLFSMIR